jgi:hypothetical protein
MVLDRLNKLAEKLFKDVVLAIGVLPDPLATLFDDEEG